MSNTNVEDYQGWHTAPQFDEDTPRDGNSLASCDYLTEMMWGGEFAETAEQIAKVKRGAETVTIYRAVPAGVDEINAGDWVSLSKAYAKKHGANRFDGGFERVAWHIVSKEVSAWELATDGNSIEEWGYCPR